MFQNKTALIFNAILKGVSRYQMQQVEHLWVALKTRTYLLTWDTKIESVSLPIDNER